jgi:hypothetical protein
MFKLLLQLYKIKYLFSMRINKIIMLISSALLKIYKNNNYNNGSIPLTEN